MKIHIKRLKKDHPVSLPQYMTEGSSGMDLFASLEKEVTLAPGERRLIPTGISVAIPEGFEGQIRPRSGLAIQKGIGIVNGPGTIDADYRGEIGVLLINFGRNPSPSVMEIGLPRWSSPKFFEPLWKRSTIFRRPGGKKEDLATQVSKKGPGRMRVWLKKQRALFPLLFI